jgi:hypothetical protein
MSKFLQAQGAKKNKQITSSPKPGTTPGKGGGGDVDF